MCGIAGIISLTDAPVARHEVESMCSAMVHRGPDEDGFYMAPGVGMGMRRLRIIDLETGRQPMRNEDGSVWTVFNGEIYNYRELRASLLSLGHRFYTSTDTETIVHLYEEYGDRCVDHLRGMFALAIWDNKQKKVLLARDRLGIKPLYYTFFGGRLCFASELKAIFEIEGFPMELNWRSVRHYAQFGTTPRENSIIDGINKLPPAHRISARRGNTSFTAERYWDVRFIPATMRTESSLVEELRHLLDESVRLHMISDVPLGAFLSGGLDSSAVVATMARASSHPVKTFSIGFKEDQYNELPHARKVAAAFGTEHHEDIVDPDALSVIENIVWHLDEPFGDSSAIPTYMVSKLASENVTVVLSGDGGDELFGGYEKYMVEKRERRRDRLPAFVRRIARSIGNVLPERAKGRRFLTHFGMTGAERYLDASTLFRTEQFSGLFTPEVLHLVLRDTAFHPELDHLDTGDEGWLSALQYRDLHHYLPLDILTKVDRMSMAHSIETRVPLLDHKLVEFAAQIPPELQIRDGETKHIFKSAMRNILSESIVDRPKHGFAVPLNTWFRGRLKDFANDVLLSSRSRQRGVFNPHYIEQLIEQHSSGRDLDLHIWSLISFELWCRTFLDHGQPNRAHKKDGYAIAAAGAAGPRRSA